MILLGTVSEVIIHLTMTCASHYSIFKEKVFDGNLVAAEFRTWECDVRVNERLEVWSPRLYPHFRTHKFNDENNPIKLNLKSRHVLWSKKWKSRTHLQLALELTTVFIQTDTTNLCMCNVFSPFCLARFIHFCALKSSTWVIEFLASRDKTVMYEHVYFHLCIVYLGFCQRSRRKKPYTM